MVRKTPNQYQISFPPSAVLRMSDADRVLGKWHTSAASYPNGKSIEPGQFHSGSCGTRDNRRYDYWFFVGAAEKAKEFFHGNDSSDLQAQWLKEHNIQ
jgi:hypothetical protein